MTRAKVGLTLLVLVVTATVFIRLGAGAGPASSSSDSQSLWMCRSCGERFVLTVGDVSALAGGSGRVTPPIDCSACKRREAYQAIVCRGCRGAYFGKDVPGSTGECPICHADHLMPTGESEEIQDGQDSERPSESGEPPGKRPMKVI